MFTLVFYRHAPCVTVTGVMGLSGQNRTEYMLGRKNQQSGFTLIEVMVAVAIVGIAVTIAVPNYIQWNARYQLQQATSEIWGYLNLARGAAMNRNTSVNVALAVASGKVTITTTTVGGVAVMPTQTIQLAHVTGVNVVGGGAIQFNSLGLRSSGAPGTNNQNLTYSIGVIPGGKAAWCPKSTCP
jgi:prepilin-type N-terminal cleavage/methylation domain-containing protein